MSLKVTDVLSPKYTAPQASWLFDVKFFVSDSIGDKKQELEDKFNSDTYFRCIKADLPKMTNTIKEMHFLGSKKSFPVYSDRSGETTLDFWFRGDPANSNNLLNYIKPESGTQPSDYLHYEFRQIFDKIQIKLVNPIIDGKNVNGKFDAHTVFKTFELYNPIITEMTTGGEVAYESDSGLKLSITVHYDNWRQMG